MLPLENWVPASGPLTQRHSPSLAPSATASLAPIQASLPSLSRMKAFSPEEVMVLRYPCSPK